MRLFKYVSPKGIDILENERIVFTPPSKFSDPHEMRLDLSPVARREFKRRLLRQIEKQAEREIQGYRQLTSRQRKKGRKEQTRGANASEMGNESFRSTIQKEFQQIGVLCLCTTKKNTLMWDHYANGFQGLVIEFDSDNEDFKKLGALWKVEYVDNPPAFDYSKPIPHFFRFKPKCYEYEGEYRIIRPFYECTRGKEENDVDLYFRPLPRACISAVYLGHRMEKSLREKILGLLSETDTQKFDVDPNQEGYELSFRQSK
jgi:hypothetical protein